MGDCRQAGCFGLYALLGLSAVHIPYKILVIFCFLTRISWDSHEKMTFSWKFSKFHETFLELFSLMRISFFSWEFPHEKWECSDMRLFRGLIWDYVFGSYTGAVIQSFLDSTYTQYRRVAHICSKVRTNPFVRQVSFFFSCSLTSAPCLVITRRLCSSNKASEQIRKPLSSKESTRSPLEEEQRSRIQSVTAPKSIPGFDIGRLLTRRGASEGVSDSDKLACWRTDWAIDRSFAFLKRFLNGCQRQFKAKMAGRIPMAYVLCIGGRRFLCTMRSASQKSWSRLQCWVVDHEAYDQLDKSFNNPAEGARSQQNAQREC